MQLTIAERRELADQANDAGLGFSTRGSGNTCDPDDEYDLTVPPSTPDPIERTIWVDNGAGYTRWFQDEKEFLQFLDDYKSGRIQTSERYIQQTPEYRDGRNALHEQMSELEPYEYSPYKYDSQEDEYLRFMGGFIMAKNHIQDNWRGSWYDEDSETPEWGVGFTACWDAVRALAPIDAEQSRWWLCGWYEAYAGTWDQMARVRSAMSVPGDLAKWAREEQPRDESENHDVCVRKARELYKA